MAVSESKVAVVTGGAAGIGEALCRELANRGAWVVVADRNLADAKQVADDIVSKGGRAEARAADVSDESQIRHLVEETAATHGHLDYLFNNAGISVGGDARD